MSALSALHGIGTTIMSNLLVKLPIPKAHPELPNQTIIVTGSNTGLGFETSRHLLRLGVGKLIMAVRSLEKGEAAKTELLASTGRKEHCVEVWHLDMDSHDSVRAFASRASELPRLDGVLANAGIMTSNFNTSEGHERTLNINVISTFLLCLLLIPKMRQSERQTGWPCRFVIPNSALHYLAPLGELDDSLNNGVDTIARLDDKSKANMGGRYPITKLLVLYGVRELADRAKASSSSPSSLGKEGRFIINAPNPSYCVSNLANERGEGVVVKTAERVLARTTEEGSRTLYHGLFAGEESNGQYLTNCHVQTPACHVTNEWGQKMQRKFVDELLSTIDRIQPGVSSCI